MVGGILLLVVPLAAQPDRAERREQRAERAEELIERLELGMSALEELGRRDLMRAVQKVAEELRQQDRKRRRDARRAENDEIRTVRRRLATMRRAVEVLVDADRVPVAEVVEHAMHARELAIEGRRDAEAARIRESAPDRAQLSEALAVAAEICADRGKREQAREIGELSRLYVEQWRRRQAAREGAREPSGIEDLNRRIEIMRLAHAAFERADREEWADYMERFVHVAELQRDGADAGRMAEAFEGLSMGRTIELLQQACGYYLEWQQKKRAAACEQLADYYASRERGADRENDREPERTRPDVRRPRRDGSRDEELRVLLHRVEQLEAEIAELRAAISRLRK